MSVTQPGGGDGERDVPRSRARAVLRIVLGVAMIGVGILHFVSPAPFVQMIPAALPAHLALVYVSGLAEIAGGVGLQIPKLRRAASWGLVALYVAVFPANINMAIHQIPLGDFQPSSFALWARLPFQLLFIAWAWWAGKPDTSASSRSNKKP